MDIIERFSGLVLSYLDVNETPLEVRKWLMDSSIKYRCYEKEMIIKRDCIEHKINNHLHRVEGPAKLLKNGTVVWYLYGKKSRIEDRPTVITRGGNRYYHKDGVLHRQTGPAIVYNNGGMRWYINGEIIDTT